MVDKITKVENGKVDILVGTHRVLSKDIKFPDLGLVIIDEEQRFGVRHKDRFHSGQGVELLRFLSQIVAFQIDTYLSEMAL